MICVARDGETSENEGISLRAAPLVTALLLCTLNSCGSDKLTRPPQTLEGTWDLIGFSDHGVSGVTTGSATFLHDGTFVILGTVTFPGETTDSLNVSGTYHVVGATVTLTTPEGTGTWSIAFSGDQVVLTSAGGNPPTTMTLQRLR
jgi:hypothetical protein